MHNPVPLWVWRVVPHLEALQALLAFPAAVLHCRALAHEFHHPIHHRLHLLTHVIRHVQLGSCRRPRCLHTLARTGEGQGGGRDERGWRRVPPSEGPGACLARGHVEKRKQARPTCPPQRGSHLHAKHAMCARSGPSLAVPSSGCTGGCSCSTHAHYQRDAHVSPPQTTSSRAFRWEGHTPLLAHWRVVTSCMVSPPAVVGYSVGLTCPAPASLHPPHEGCFAHARCVACWGGYR